MALSDNTFQYMSRLRLHAASTQSEKDHGMNTFLFRDTTVAQSSL